MAGKTSPLNKPVSHEPRTGLTLANYPYNCAYKKGDVNKSMELAIDSQTVRFSLANDAMTVSPKCSRLAMLKEGFACSACTIGF